MYTTKLRKVGGSVMLAVPPAILDALGLAADTSVGLEIIDGEIVVKLPRPRYRLDDLLSQCDAKSSLSDEDRAWLDDGPIGLEQI